MEEFKLNFLCVGFNKSGTTTLARLLQENKEIYLPENKKEILFFDWYQNYDNPIEIMQKKYYPAFNQKERCLGGIEPSYCKKAKDVYEIFGKDTKIIFMMRNPVSATFSMFKMRLRRIRSKKYCELYKDHKNDFNSMFMYWIENFVKTKKEADFFYDSWIKEYLKYFPKEQLKFIIMEELIKEPSKEMKELYQFLGVHPIEQNHITKSNKSSLISKNYLSARINYYFSRWNFKQRSKEANNEHTWNEKTMKIMKRFTLKNYTEPMSQEAKQKLEAIYKDSIDEVEKITGKNLKNIWN